MIYSIKQKFNKFSRNNFHLQKHKPDFIMVLKIFFLIMIKCDRFKYNNISRKVYMEIRYEKYVECRYSAGKVIISLYEDWAC